MGPTGHQAMPRCSRILDLQTALFLLATLIFLYPFLFIPPFIPLNTGNDVFVSDGMRMFEGEVIYRDFFQFVPPGTPLIFFLLFKLFGLRLWIPDLMLLLLGLGLAGLGVVVAKKLMRPGLALLPSAMFLVVAREFIGGAPDHHWYSLLTGTAAMAALMERRTPGRIAAAGFFCGLSACFTQSRGLAVVVAFGVFLWWNSQRRQEGWRKLLKKEAWLLTSFLATLIAVNAYFIWKAGLARFLWCTVVFGLKYYPKDAGNTFQTFTNSVPAFVPLRHLLHWDVVQWLFLIAAIPFILILFLARYWRDSGRKPVEYWERPMLVAIVGFFMLLSVAPSPNPYRVAVSGFPALILLGWFFDSPRKLARALAAAFAVGVLLVALNAVARKRPLPVGIIATTQGKVAFTAQGAYQESTWVQQHTRPLEYLYDTGYAPSLLFNLNLRNPTPIFFITNNGYTTVKQVAEIIRGLEEHPVRYIFWSSDEVDKFPKWEDPAEDHLGPLRDYVHHHYRLAKIFEEGDEIWEKKD